MGTTCQAATCQSLRELCDYHKGDDHCCQDEPSVCDLRFSDDHICGPGPYCQHLVGGSCSDKCDCLPPMECEYQRCCSRQFCETSSDCCPGLECISVTSSIKACRPACGTERRCTGGTCQDSCDCCATTDICVEGRCCATDGTACTADEQCCGECVNGVCVQACYGGSTRCGGLCCGSHLICCGDRCVDHDHENCGACGNRCLDPGDVDHYAICHLGQCLQRTCPPGVANCDGDPWNGCEADLMNDPNNCGACGYVCHPTNHVFNPHCVQGTCCAYGGQSCQDLPCCDGLVCDPIFKYCDWPR